MNVDSFRLRLVAVTIKCEMFPTSNESVGYSYGQRSMTVAPASGGVEVNQQGSPGDTIESAREDDRANSQITGPEVRFSCQ